MKKLLKQFKSIRKYYKRKWAFNEKKRLAIELQLKTGRDFHVILFNDVYYVGDNTLAKHLNKVLKGLAKPLTMVDIRNMAIYTATKRVKK